VTDATKQDGGPEVAKSDTFGLRQTGEDSAIRVQIKAGDPIPADVVVEGAKGHKELSKLANPSDPGDPETSHRESHKTANRNTRKRDKAQAEGVVDHDLAVVTQESEMTRHAREGDEE
jgi:hypothetical protein